MYVHVQVKREDIEVFVLPITAQNQIIMIIFAVHKEQYNLTMRFPRGASFLACHA